MFELYTERARRVIFFSRYEASQFGSTTIETHHVLLGLLREDKNLMVRLIKNLPSVESVLEEIHSKVQKMEKIPSSIDLPLSNESKRILAYANEEAERLAHRYIDTEHLLLGILREKDSLAAGILREKGLNLEAVREELALGAGPARGRTPTQFLHLNSNTLTEALEKHKLEVPRQLLMSAITARTAGDIKKAQFDLQLFLESLVATLRERTRGDAALLPTFEGFDWGRSLGGFRSGLSDEEDWKFTFGLTLLVGELLVARYEGHT